ncbi:hypothetical protein IU427_18475 [Nocardia beijingensis]|uniref:hypothetical protein n=1 Tax=Nocardia beijingensis TaxID=95162 RepID=UPI001895216A|nr:hypothetical protein [Nocardia beijingensis]MBF6467152.1 hypothetical protein [Nocardia beijingensis]
MTEQSARRLRTRVTPLAVGLVLATAGAATRPFSWPATALVAVAALGAMVLTFRGRIMRLPRTARLGRGLAMWSALLVAASAWELYALLRQPALNRPSHEHPTLSTLLDPALEQWPLRFAGWLVWLAAGWWLVSR